MSDFSRCPFCQGTHEEAFRLGGFPIQVCEKTPWPGWYLIDRKQWSSYADAVRFLEKHKDADEIVMDTATGRPVKAVYTHVRGAPRADQATAHWGARQPC